MRVIGDTQVRQSGTPRPEWQITLGTLVLVCAGYVAGSTVAYWLIHLSEAGAVFFPAAGVSLAALVLSPRSRWPAIVLTVAATEFVIDQVQGHSIAATLGFVAANSLEPLVGAWLLRRASGADLELSRRRDLGNFVIYAVMVGPLVGGLIGGSTIIATGGSGWLETVASFWAGDAMGVLSVGAAIVTGRFWRRTLQGSILALVGCAAFTALVFWPAVPLSFLAALPLLWLAFQGNVAALCAGGLGMTIAANVTTALGHGRWASLQVPAVEVATLQLFLATVVLSAWALAVEIREREIVSGQYRAARNSAIELQRELLPKIPADIWGVQVGALYRPGDIHHEVGGDWYDVFTPRTGTVALVVGDIVGHDLAAAAAMGRTYTAVRLLAEQAVRTPGEVLDALDAVCHVLPESAYSTVGYAEFIPSSQMLTYACAGHPPPLLVDGTGARFLMDGRSTPVAVSNGKRCTGEIQLTGPARLVWYSDGLIERRGESIEEALERLREVVENLNSQDSPDEWCDEILAAMLTGEALEDDVVVLCAALHGGVSA